MDPTYLYHNHGVSLVMAANAACESSRDATPAFAAAYANRVADALRSTQGIGTMISPVTREEVAEGLREQAASCRRLAKRARTDSGATALQAVAEQFDTDARRMDPRSWRR